MLGSFVVLDKFEPSSFSDFMNAVASLFAVNDSGRAKFPLTGDCPVLIGDFGVLKGLMCLCFCGETDVGCPVCD